MTCRARSSPPAASHELAPGRERRTVAVVNTGDRPIQVGSHFHFARRQPGAGVRSDGRGRLSPRRARRARRCASSPASMSRSALVALAGTAHRPGSADPPVSEIDRDRYAALYGPTTGDRVRLADTDLFIEVERDLTGPPGDEAVFGGGKTIRESMLQGRRHPRRRRPRRRDHQRPRARPPRHRQGRRRDPRRPHRRARQGRQPRHRRRRPPGAADRRRAPRSSPARAASSPPAASTATSTSSRRRS